MLRREFIGCKGTSDHWLIQGFDYSFYILSSHLLHLSVQLRHVEMLLPVSHLHYRLRLWRQTILHFQQH